MTRDEAGSSGSRSHDCRAFIGLGANLGDPQLALAEALTRLAALPGTRLIATSSRYRSAPVGGSGPDYLNQVAKIGTTLDPETLLDQLQAIERAAGRQRGPDRNAPRTLDLDLLLYGDRRDGACQVVTRDTLRLTLPHPRMHQRAFVLMPLVELDPSVEVPGQGEAAVLLARLKESTEGTAQRCERLDEPRD